MNTYNVPQHFNAYLIFFALLTLCNYYFVYITEISSNLPQNILNLVQISIDFELNEYSTILVVIYSNILQYFNFDLFSIFMNLFIYKYKVTAFWLKK